MPSTLNPVLWCYNMSISKKNPVNEWDYNSCVFCTSNSLEIGIISTSLKP